MKEPRTLDELRDVPVAEWTKEEKRRVHRCPGCEHCKPKDGKRLVPKIDRTSGHAIPGEYEDLCRDCRSRRRAIHAGAAVGKSPSESLDAVDAARGRQSAYASRLMNAGS